MIDHIKKLPKFFRISDQQVKKIRTEVFLWVFVTTVSIVFIHIAVDKPNTFLDGLKGLFEGWPAGALSISFTVILLFFVDGVRDKAELIEETLQRQLTSFKEINKEALRLLEWVTDPTKSRNLILNKTSFYMTSAAPVFGLEEDPSTRERWMELLRRRGAGHAETNLFCYSWQAPNGIEESALGRFSKKLAQAGGTSISSWYQACVMAWDQYDKLFPAGHGDHPDKALKIYLINEPDFGVVYARHNDGNEEAIIYISNSHSISKDAVAFSTRDRNWIGLIKLTFKAQMELNKLALLEFPRRGHAEIFRDKQLYKEFAEQGDERRELELTYRSSTDRSGDPIPIAVFPGVFPPKMGLDTSYVIRALNIVLPRLGELVRAGMVVDQEGHQIASILGVDVGTGTGVLGLVMAMHRECPITIVATDNYGPAVKNASLNFRRAAELSPALAEALKLKGKIEGKLSKADVRKKYQRNEIPDDSICVINCDLAQLVHRANDNEMMLFVFNYPAYQSPSNIFNTGGKRAGQIIVEEFLKDLYERLRPSDIILLPEIAVSARGSSFSVGVADLAERFEYCCMPINVGGQDVASAGEFHVTVKVFALAKAVEKGDSDWRKHPFLSLMAEKLPHHKGLDGPVLR
jgi:hypothetical protein